MFDLYFLLKPTFPNASVSTLTLMDFVESLFNKLDDYPGTYTYLASLVSKKPEKFLESPILDQLNQLIEFFEKIEFFSFMAFVEQWQFSGEIQN